MKLEEFIEVLFYGSSKFGDYDSGINIESIAPEIHRKYFGVVDEYWKNAKRY